MQGLLGAMLAHSEEEITNPWNQKTSSPEPLHLVKIDLKPLVPHPNLNSFQIPRQDVNSIAQCARGRDVNLDIVTVLMIAHSSVMDDDGCHPVV